MPSPDGSEDVVYVPIPFGLVKQWLQFKRWQLEEPSLRSDLGVGLNDWEGRWSMLHWITERVIDDHDVASRVPRDYTRDVSLEHHLTYWFMTARLCYDTMAFITVQMAAGRDRGKLSAVSFNDLAKAKRRESFQDATNDLLEIVRQSQDSFEELKSIRDSLVHFIGKSGKQVEAPKRIKVEFPNEQGVKFTVERCRFADIHGSADKWPVVETLRRHFRSIYETVDQLECCFPTQVATDRIPGAYRYMTKAMFAFLDCESIDDLSQQRWETTASESL